MLNLSHKSLDVYKISLLLMQDIYRLTQGFPKTEQFGLVSQLRRASVSVCSNLAEGASRISTKEKKRFYEIARSSLVEIDTQIEVSMLLNYLQKDDVKELEKYEESTFRILSKLISNIATSQSPKTTSH